MRTHYLFIACASLPWRDHFVARALSKSQFHCLRFFALEGPLCRSRLVRVTVSEDSSMMSSSKELPGTDEGKQIEVKSTQGNQYSRLRLKSCEFFCGEITQ